MTTPAQILARPELMWTLLTIADHPNLMTKDIIDVSRMGYGARKNRLAELQSAGMVTRPAPGARNNGVTLTPFGAECVRNLRTMAAAMGADGDSLRIEFPPELASMVLAGTKTATTRRTRHGEPGDMFSVVDPDGREGVYVIEAIDRGHVSTICERYHREEGYGTPEGMWNALQVIYPGITQKSTVYCHLFRRLGS